MGFSQDVDATVEQTIHDLELLFHRTRARGKAMTIDCTVHASVEARDAGETPGTTVLTLSPVDRSSLLRVYPVCWDTAPGGDPTLDLWELQDFEDVVVSIATRARSTPPGSDGVYGHCHAAPCAAASNGSCPLVRTPLSIAVADLKEIFSGVADVQGPAHLTHVTFPVPILKVDGKDPVDPERATLQRHCLVLREVSPIVAVSITVAVPIDSHTRMAFDPRAVGLPPGAGMIIRRCLVELEQEVRTSLSLVGAVLSLTVNGAPRYQHLLTALLGGAATIEEARDAATDLLSSPGTNVVHEIFAITPSTP